MSGFLRLSLLAVILGCLLLSATAIVADCTPERLAGLNEDVDKVERELDTCERDLGACQSASQVAEDEYRSLLQEEQKLLQQLNAAKSAAASGSHRRKPLVDEADKKPLETITAIQCHTGGEAAQLCHYENACLNYDRGEIIILTENEAARGGIPLPNDAHLGEISEYLGEPYVDGIDWSKEDMDARMPYGVPLHSHFNASIWYTGDIPEAQQFKDQTMYATTIVDGKHNAVPKWFYSKFGLLYSTLLNYKQLSVPEMDRLHFLGGELPRWKWAHELLEMTVERYGSKSAKMDTDTSESIECFRNIVLLGERPRVFEGWREAMHLRRFVRGKLGVDDKGTKGAMQMYLVTGAVGIIDNPEKLYRVSDNTAVEQWTEKILGGKSDVLEFSDSAMADKPLREIVSAFSKYGVAVCLHSEHCVHSLWMDSGATLIELFPFGIRSKWNQNVAQTADLYYIPVRTFPNSVKTISGDEDGCDFCKDGCSSVYIAHMSPHCRQLWEKNHAVLDLQYLDYREAVWNAMDWAGKRIWVSPDDR